MDGSNDWTPRIGLQGLEVVMEMGASQGGGDGSLPGRWWRGMVGMEVTEGGGRLLRHRDGVTESDCLTGRGWKVGATEVQEDAGLQPAACRALGWDPA